jgi:hypothetical protein
MFAFLRINARALLVTLGAAAWAVTPFAAFSQPRSQPAATDLAATLESGFARLVFTFPEEIKTDVQLANNVLVIRFAKPVRVSIDGVQSQFKDFVQAARVDPDGSAVRIAFAQKITVNTMEAGEKLFVDMLPESWVGLPPGLPQEVVDDLAKRARDAERKARVEQAPRVWQPVKVRFGEAPGFSRYAFTTSEPIQIAADQEGQEVRITFNAPVKIDFGDALVSLPPSVISLDADYTDSTAVVRLVLAPNATLRHFRESSAFVADIMTGSPAKPEQLHGEVQQTPPANAQAEILPQAQPADKPAQAAPPVLPQAPVAEAVKPELAAPETGEVRATVTLAPNGVRIFFPFKEPIASAVFRRGDRIWMVFDTKREINVSELIADHTRSFSDVSVADTGNGKVVRLKLKGGWLTSAESDGQSWTVHFGDAVVGVTRPLFAQRMAEANGAMLAIPIEGAAKGKVHTIDDPEIGDDIRAVTVLAPVRGVLRGQNFLEFKLLPSAHGVALQPLADDLEVVPGPGHVSIGRPKGLVLSTAPRASNARPVRTSASSPLDAMLWEAERNRRFAPREAEIMNAAVEAPANQRHVSRMNLATFYLAHGLATEAKGTLDTIVREDSKAPIGGSFYLLRGLSELMIGRPALALENLTHGELAESHEAALLRAVAYSEISAWAEARENFRAGSAALKMLAARVCNGRCCSRPCARRSKYAISPRPGALMNELDAHRSAARRHEGGIHGACRPHVLKGLGRTDRAAALFDAAAKTNDGACRRRGASTSKSS